MALSCATGSNNVVYSGDYESHRISATSGRVGGWGQLRYIYMMESQKKLDTKARVIFSGWQYSMRIVTLHCQEELTLSLTPVEEDKQKLSIWNPTRICLMHLFCWLILIFLYPFAEINHNFECTGF